MVARVAMQTQTGGEVKPHLPKRKEAYFILPLVRLSNHHKNMPYVGLKLWNSFINVSVTSTLDLLHASLLLYWKLSKFKFVKDTLLHFQSVNNFIWDSSNFNLLELEASVLTGNLNPGSI